MTYDLLGAIDSLFPGIVVQETLIQAAETRWLAKGAPLASNDVAGILAAANVLNAAQAVASYVPSLQPNYPGTLPAYPTGLPRFPDDLGGMTAPDGWNITYDGKVVFG